MKSSLWSIGDVAARFAMPTHVLRHWEAMGLLAPERDAGGRRVYTADDLVRVAAVQANQSAGMSLEQIRSLFDTESEGRRAVLRQHLVDLDRRMLELEASREITRHALECEAHDLTTCPRFRAALTSLVESGPGIGPHERADFTFGPAARPRPSGGGPGRRQSRSRPE